MEQVVWSRVVTMEMIAAIHLRSALEVELIRPAGCGGEGERELHIFLHFFRLIRSALLSHFSSQFAHLQNRITRWEL